MDTKSPQFWRTINGVGVALLALALLVMFLGASTNSEFWVFAGLWALFGAIIVALVSQTELKHAQNRVVDEAYKQQNQLETRTQVRCESCGKLNDESNKFCGRCGQTFG